MPSSGSRDEAGHIQADHLVVDDWGILTPLIVLHGNRLPLVFADQSFLAPGSRPRPTAIGPCNVCRKMFGLAIRRNSSNGPARTKGSSRVARAAGFEKHIIETVPDRNGRPVFEIFRFVRDQRSGRASN